MRSQRVVFSLFRFIFSSDTTMQFKPADACRFDILSLGEVMLRLDPADGRVRTARSFDVWEGAASTTSPADCVVVSV